MPCAGAFINTRENHLPRSACGGDGREAKKEERRGSGVGAASLGRREESGHAVALQPLPDNGAILDGSPAADRAVVERPAPQGLRRREAAFRAESAMGGVRGDCVVGSFA